MAWQKSSAELVALFQQTVPSGHNIAHKQMFGYPCAFVSGNLFTGLFQQSMIFRLSPADRAAFLDRANTAEFEPMPGRKMTGYVMLQDPFAADEHELDNWMKCALHHASSLPPKVSAASKKKAQAAKKQAPAAKRRASPQPRSERK